VDDASGRAPSTGNDQRWQTVRVRWRERATGREGVYDEPNDKGSASCWWDGETLNKFMWEDGNYSCDCNRALFFLDEDYDDLKCGDCRFEILSIEPLHYQEPC
jgi:hypothetical protein